MKIGANLNGNNTCEFSVWAPEIESMEVVLEGSSVQYQTMFKDEGGYWHAKVPGVKDGDKYKFCINGDQQFPDPASHHQPNDVHNASAVIDHSLFEWTDEQWKGIKAEELIIYEIHTGTFTKEGTFEAIANRLDDLLDLGITAIELMPVSEFPGDRNWGYDGVYPFAPESSYGGPEGLKKLVNACHERGMGVILDVVYNHFGPEGNYTSQYAPYFTDRYRTPWGDAMNFDHAYSGGVRNYFIKNALHWMTYYHIDGLRLDAIDTIFDLGAKHFLQELSENVSALSAEIGKHHLLIAESDLNDVKVIRGREEFGYGLDMQWADDFHHSLHSFLTGENAGYYSDFGRLKDLSEAYMNSFVYDGKYSNYRKRVHGNIAADRPCQQFVVCIQNHDQIGNRAFGERISSLISFESHKLAAAIVLLSPYTPLLFMGEEYGEPAPFLYFVSHTDEALSQAVSRGRRDEFSSFKWKGDIPDPSSESTYNKAKINWDLREENDHRSLLEFYKELIYLRKNNRALLNRSRQSIETKDYKNEKVITISRKGEGAAVFVINNFNMEAVTLKLEIPPGKWKKIIDSASEKWAGAGGSTPEEILGNEQNITIKKESVTIYEKTGE